VEQRVTGLGNGVGGINGLKNQSEKCEGRRGSTG
jgi:hypothetical protein